jgi:ABC-type Mn2+/Zn2+ transport system permease subunit
MHTIPILLGGLLTLLLGLIAWSVWTGVRAELEESAVGWHQDVLLGLLLFAMFGLGVFVAFLVLDLVK